MRVVTCALAGAHEGAHALGCTRITGRACVSVLAGERTCVYAGADPGALCVCVCACVRACVCVCVCACVRT